MILFNDKLEELNKISEEDIYILTDFDGTITQDNSDSSWATIFKNPKVTPEFVHRCKEIFNYYHKFEIDESIELAKKMDIMNEWYKKNIETLKEFKITKEIINCAANENVMTFRVGAKEFLKNMDDKNIPVIIISAGVGNIIEEFLIKNNCNYSNIFICSNFLEYENGVVKGVRDNNLIHSLNKNEVSLPQNVKNIISKRKNILLLGNSVLDLSMAGDNKNVYKLGFLDEKIEERLQSFKENFDIVCTNNTTYKKLSEKIKVLGVDKWKI